MSPGQIAALIAAGALVVLVLLLAVPLIKLGRTLDEATETLRKTHTGTEPLLHGASTTVGHVNTQLERFDGITRNAKTVTGNVSALSSLFTATMGGPLVKAAAVSYGVSKAIRGRRKQADAQSTGRHARGGSAAKGSKKSRKKSRKKARARR